MSETTVPARSRDRWQAIVVLLVVVCVLALASFASDRSTAVDQPAAVPATAAPPVTDTGDDRPNIILFSSDDQRLDEMVFLPQIESILGDQGLTFDQAITPHPLCCPARAEIMTGQLAQNNHVRTNFPPQGGYTAYDPSSSIGTDLSAAGYNTAFLGKPLNGYDSKYGRDPGWTLFNATAHGYSDYYKFTQYDNDHIERLPGYYTDYLSDKAVEYAHQLHEYDAPFFMWVSHFAPHPTKGREGCEDPTCKQGPPKMSPSYRMLSRISGRTPNQTQALLMAQKILASPGYREHDLSDKPHAIQKQKPSSPQKVIRIQRARAAALSSLDDAFSRLIDQLREDGELDNTYIVFITDNGYQLGEHRWFGKTLPYEENVRMPLLVRGPGISPGTTTDEMVTTVDLTATFLDIAGATPDRTIDGRSMLPLWHGDTTPLHPGGTLIQGGPYMPETGKTGWLYRGVRTDRYMYARYYDGFVEMYDLDKDPGEVHSLAGHPRYAAIQAELARRTTLLSGCSGQEKCNRDFGPMPEPGDPVS